MTSEFNDLLKDIQKVGQAFKQLDYRVHILYETQWSEKVTNGYKKWRFDSNGGLKLIREQLKQLAYKCPICHESLSETSATIDHLLPKSKYLGSALATHNMLVMCHACNSVKSNQEFEAWYSQLPSAWKTRLCKAIQEIHGTIKLIELFPSTQTQIQPTIRPD